MSFRKFLGVAAIVFATSLFLFQESPAFAANKESPSQSLSNDSDDSSEPEDVPPPFLASRPDSATEAKTSEDSSTDKTPRPKIISEPTTPFPPNEPDDYKKYILDTTVTDVCGNGVVESFEECDDGNVTDGDGCSSICELETLCGNGIVDASAGEGCDDGNLSKGDGCGPDCQVEAVCGNGIKEKGETCDVGDVVPGDGCSATCQTETAVCGNGIKEAGEACDDGNQINNDGCSNACKLPQCGDGILQPGEQCENVSQCSSIPGQPLVCDQCQCTNCPGQDQCTADNQCPNGSPRFQGSNCVCDPGICNLATCPSVRTCGLDTRNPISPCWDPGSITTGTVNFTTVQGCPAACDYEKKSCGGLPAPIVFFNQRIFSGRYSVPGFPGCECDCATGAPLNANCQGADERDACLVGRPDPGTLVCPQPG